MLTYFSDYQQKTNYCNEYVLKKQKENLMEILEFFPDCLLIMDKTLKKSSILYQNQKMQEFTPEAEELLWDENLKVFSKKNANDNLKVDNGFETESELISVD